MRHRGEAPGPAGLRPDREETPMEGGNRLAKCRPPLRRRHSAPTWSKDSIRHAEAARQRRWSVACPDVPCGGYARLKQGQCTAQSPGLRGAPGYVDIYGNELADPSGSRVGMERPARDCAGSHGHHPSRGLHLVVGVEQQGCELEGDPPPHDQEISMARRDRSQLPRPGGRIEAPVEPGNVFRRAAAHPEEQGTQRMPA